MAETRFLDVNPDPGSNEKPALGDPLASTKVVQPVAISKSIIPSDAVNPDQMNDEEKQNVLDSYLQAVLFLQKQYDPGAFGWMERATKRLAELTEGAGDSVEGGANNAATAIENSNVGPAFIRKGLARGIRKVGALLNRGAHRAARGGERHALAVEHSAAMVFVPVSGNFLQRLALHESGGNTFAHAPTSSASGLYQFLKDSWLGVVYQHGKEHGGALAEAATHIHRVGKRYECDTGWEGKILAMREDAQLSTLMAQDFTKDNAAAVQHILGNRPLNNTDLYMAHFLGPTQAARFLRALDQNPNAEAAALFPEQARPNHWVFFDKRTGARSLSQVYAYLDRDFNTQAVRGDIRLADNASHRPALSRPGAPSHPQARA